MTSISQAPAGSRRPTQLRVLPLLRHGGAAALTLLGLVALWWVTAPPALGGKTTIVTVDGTSMLPHYKRADLVALRQASRYNVGDVVGYRSSMLHRVVIHRIVGIKNGRYTFKGDNNSFTDPEQPTRAELIGKDAMHLPAAGNLLQLLRKPWVLALLAALAILTLGVDIRRDPGNDPASL